MSQFDGTDYAPTNCGPASLAMVLRYFGEAGATPDQVRRSIARLPGAGYAADPGQGTAIQDLARAARQRGLDPVPGNGPSWTGWTPARIAEHVQQGHPVIVLTRLNALPGWANAPADFEHWIVVVGVSGDRLVYNDSAMGGGLSMSSGQLQSAMSHASIPGQGSAFAGGSRANGAPAIAAPPAEPTRLVVSLVRIGNGSRLVMPAAPSATPVAQDAEPEDPPQAALPSAIDLGRPAIAF